MAFKSKSPKSFLFAKPPKPSTAQALLPKAPKGILATKKPKKKKKKNYAAFDHGPSVLPPVPMMPQAPQAPSSSY